MFTGLWKYEATRPDEFWSTTVPAHWQVMPGMAVLTENKARNTGLTESQVLSLSYGRVIIKPVEKQRGLVPDSYEGYQILEPGDIVIRPTDLQNDQRSIRVGRVRDRGIITSAYIGLRSKEPWTTDYAYLYLTAVDSTKRIYGMGSGLRQQLGWPDLKRMPCLVPPADEQAAIVKYLAHANARIDKAIAAKRRLIDLLAEEKVALLARVIGDAAADRMRLKHVASIQTGLTLGKDYREQPMSEYPYLRVANVQMGHVDTTDVATVAVPTAEAERCTLRAGDVLMTEGGDIDKLGRGTVWDGSVDGCLHQNHVFAVRCGARLLPEFLAAWLAAPEPRFYFYVTAKKTTNLAATNSTTVRELPMVVPPLDEQRRLLALLSAQSAPLDLAKAKAAREIDLLREFRGRLVADAVTGQVDVRELAASLPEPSVGTEAVDLSGDMDELDIDEVAEMSEV
jgi:type I restriction enzyme S subunit